MAIVQNISNEEGDVIQIQTDVPLVGIAALSSFQDTTSENAGSFLREFRYSLDGGITYSAWLELTNGNLQAINFSSTSIFFAQYRFTIEQLNESGELEWEDLTLYGSGEYPDDGPIYDNSVFSQYFGAFDVRVLTWAVNVLEKMYLSGIVPEYIERGKGDDDTDYLEFWKPICIFFAYLVQLGREFEFFHNNAYLANKYLLNKGHFTCGHEQLDELLLIIANLLRIRAERGTSKMYQEATIDYPVDGELLRLICFDGNVDYFKFGFPLTKYVGWNVDNVSPLFRGKTGRIDLNSAYEDTEDVETLSKYPILNPSYVSIVNDSNGSGSGSGSGGAGDRQVLLIDNVPVGQIAGIGLVSDSKKIMIDRQLNFEITFFVSQDVNDSNITFKCLGYDSGGNSLQFKNIVTNLNSNIFFEKKALNKENTFYFVRGIIYNSDAVLLTADQARLNIGFGNQLKMHPNTIKIIPYIVLDNTDGATPSNAVKIWDLKITPCSLDYSSTYMDNGRFADVILKNNNATYNRIDIDSIMRKYFVPYSIGFINTHLGL